jgi:hypothetical protein
MDHSTEFLFILIRFYHRFHLNSSGKTQHNPASTSGNSGYHRSAEKRPSENCTFRFAFNRQTRSDARAIVFEVMRAEEISAINNGRKVARTGGTKLIIGGGRFGRLSKRRERQGVRSAAGEAGSQYCASSPAHVSPLAIQGPDPS